MLKKLTPKQKLFAMLVAFVILATLVLGKSIHRLVHNKWEKRTLQKRQVQLDKQYEQLQQLLQKLEQKDPVYLEHLARTQYNMVKPGEVEFRFENEN